MSAMYKRADHSDPETSHPPLSFASSSMVDLEKAKIEVESSSSECNPTGLTAHKCTPSTPSAIPEGNAPDTAEYTFPEGGTRAWMTVFGAALFLFCTGPQTAFGIFQSWYSEHQLRHTSLSDISWIGSLAACLIYFTVRTYLRLCNGASDL